MYNISISNFHQRKHEVMFESSCGLLEGVFFKGSHHPVQKIALILPPDPSFKATMNNRIVNSIFKAFEASGFATLKINYRGTGKSQGESLTKEDKIVDALESLDWLIKKCESPEVPDPAICVAGFALGGWLALQCAMRRPEITNFVAVNSSFDSSDFNMLTPCPNGIIIQSNKDVLSNIDDSIDFHSQLISQKGSQILHKTIEDDHSFKNNLPILEENLNIYTKSICSKNHNPSN